MSEFVEMLWRVLLDNQSTCDVIINKRIVINIHERDCTLVLRTQSEDCRINRIIADLPGVGTVCFYCEGVPSILLQYQMILYSKWKVDFSSDQFYCTGNVRDLKEISVTSKGI